MEHTADFLIVGQGIAGILITFELIQKGNKCLLLDDGNRDAASDHAGALLNPINLNNGKLFPKQQEELTIALQTYQKLETFLDATFIDRFPLFVFPDKNELIEFERNTYFQPIAELENNEISKYFQTSKGIWKLAETQRIRFQILKTKWRNYWQSKGLYLQESFDQDLCEFSPEEINYKGFKIKKIIFAEGVKGSTNSYFRDLPFTRNLGNILRLQIGALPSHFACHLKGKKLLPLGNHEFWFGSNYQWQFKDTKPDVNWQRESIAMLEQQLKVPFKVLKHDTAQRPTTAGQKPLLLQSTEHPRLYFFNGLGTRGFLTGPSQAKLMGKYF